MRQLLIVALPYGALACEQLPRCVETGELVGVDGDDNGRDVSGAISDARLDAADMLVTICDESADPPCATLRIATMNGVAPALPDVGVHVDGSCNTTGEGCTADFWRANDFFEVGRLSALDDDDFSDHRDASRLSVQYPASDESACDDRVDDTDPAAIFVRSDEGDIELAPGARQRVTIDGVAWFAMAGHARRSQFFQEPGCFDCPGPGWHSSVSGDALLYRIAQ